MLRGETSAAGGFPSVGIWRTRRVVRGTTILKTAVRRVATSTMRATGTTTSVFVLCVLLRALFCTRTGGWEFVGRVLRRVQTCSGDAGDSIRKSNLAG